MSNTPRTDAEEELMGGLWWVQSDLARALERELAEGDVRICRALGMETVSHAEALNVIDGLQRELAEANLSLSNSHRTVEHLTCEREQERKEADHFEAMARKNAAYAGELKDALAKNPSDSATTLAVETNGVAEGQRVEADRLADIAVNAVHGAAVDYLPSLWPGFYVSILKQLVEQSKATPEERNVS